MGKAFQFYSSDYNDYNVPPEGLGSQQGSPDWMNKLTPYINAKKSVFIDPAVAQGRLYVAGSSVDNQFLYHYGICCNPQMVLCSKKGIDPNSNYNFWRYRYKITQIAKPSQAAAVADTIYGGSTPILSTDNQAWSFKAWSGGISISYLDWYRHNNQSNWLYMDGHVTSYNKGEFWSKGTNMFGANMGKAWGQ